MYLVPLIGLAKSAWQTSCGVSGFIRRSSASCVLVGATDVNCRCRWRMFREEGFEKFCISRYSFGASIVESTFLLRAGSCAERWLFRSRLRGRLKLLTQFPKRYAKISRRKKLGGVSGRTSPLGICQPNSVRCREGIVPLHPSHAVFW